MKKTLVYMLGIVLAVMGLTACSPEKFDHPSEADLPTISEANVVISVDQTTNTVTFTLNNEGCYPVWMIHPSTTSKNIVYTTVNGYQRIFASAGTYEVEYRIGNKNGLSQATGKATFTIDNTIVNFDNIYTKLAGGAPDDGVSAKVWYIDRSKAAHMACGESGTDGTNWWSATPDEKAAYGVYDNALTFTNDNLYIFDPGASGTMYVNTGCTMFPDYHQDQDFMVPVDLQSVNYSFEVDGANLYLVLPAHTQFPYISNDDQWASPKFLIQSITSSEIVLIYDNGAIAWHFILGTGESGSDTFDGYDYTSDCNLWKKATISQRFWYANTSWSQIDDPDCVVDGNSYTLTFPTATNAQWQAQCFWETDMTTTSENTYDFSCHFVANANHNNVTVKLYQNGDDGVFYFIENITLVAGEEYVFYKSDLPGMDIEKVNLVIDFGGCPDNFEVTVSKIDLQEHACDGIVAPTGGGDDDDTEYDYNSSGNLWRTMVDDPNNYTTFMYYAPNWSQIADPGFSKNGNSYYISLPTATSTQWQAQVHLISTIEGEADTDYDFACDIVSNTDIKAATVKMTDNSDDGNYYFTERVDLVANETAKVRLPKVSIGTAASALKLVFDFGGNPEDTEVTISDIIFQKSAQ